jgi:hypothetical protein
MEAKYQDKGPEVRPCKSQRIGLVFKHMIDEITVKVTENYNKVPEPYNFLT